MAKIVHNNVLDAALTYLGTASTIECMCGTQPTTRTEAITTYALGTVAVSSGDFAVADAAGGGRQSTVASKASVAVSASGTANFVALVDGTNLLYVNTCTAQPVTSGNTATIGTWIVTLGDPT